MTTFEKYSNIKEEMEKIYNLTDVSVDVLNAKFDEDVSITLSESRANGGYSMYISVNLEEAGETFEIRISDHDNSYTSKHAMVKFNEDIAFDINKLNVIICETAVAFVESDYDIIETGFEVRSYEI